MCKNVCVLKFKPKENMANLSSADGSMTVSDKDESEVVVFPFEIFCRTSLRIWYAYGYVGTKFKKKM